MKWAKKEVKKKIVKIGGLTIANYPTICTETFLGEKVIKSDDAFNHSDCALVSEKLLIKSLQFSEV